MVTYEYTAKNNTTGEMLKAEVQADSTSAAAKLLVDQGLFPITIQDKSKQNVLAKVNILNRVSTRDLVIFTRQLSTLINAGLPLVQSLHNVQSQLSSKTLKEAAADIIASVEGGMSLSEALGKHPKIFNEIYVYLVAAGETSGTLDKVLERLADQQEKDAAILRKIRSAMIYPLIVLVVVVLVVVFLLVTLLPQVAQLYHDLHRNLPILTRILVDISSFVIKYWWLVLLLVGGGLLAGYNYVRSETGRHQYDNFKLSVPLFGTLFEKVYMARFARTLSVLLNSGIPMLKGMEVTRKAIHNLVVEGAIERAEAKVKGGKALSKALEVEESFLPLVSQMTAIGEQSGALDDMLVKVAMFYEEDVDTAVKNLSTTIEPVMIVILGTVVAFIIAAVLLPIYGLVGSGGLNNF
ncbi:MAG TPA: type II secretion system F family protein [Candidatus Saccharimonadales bacterium]|nr:type II secretion system F family protein [Candidatus Saccharimonadales bacterium]